MIAEIDRLINMHQAGLPFEHIYSHEDLARMIEFMRKDLSRMPVTKDGKRLSPGDLCYSIEDRKQPGSCSKHDRIWTRKPIGLNGRRTDQIAEVSGFGHPEVPSFRRVVECYSSSEEAIKALDSLEG